MIASTACFDADLALLPCGGPRACSAPMVCVDNQCQFQCYENSDCLSDQVCERQVCVSQKLAFHDHHDQAIHVSDMTISTDMDTSATEEDMMLNSTEEDMMSSGFFTDDDMNTQMNETTDMNILLDM